MGGGYGWLHLLRRAVLRVAEVPVRETLDLQPRSQFETGYTHEVVDARRHRRFKLEVDIRVYPRDCPVVRGDTVDISESGISAMLRLEVPSGEVVRLEFTLPSGDVEILAWFASGTPSATAFSSWKALPHQPRASSSAPAASLRWDESLPDHPGPLKSEAHQLHKLFPRPTLRCPSSDVKN